MRRRHPETEATIASKQRQGRGSGEGATYLPWIFVTDFSSTGQSRRLRSEKLGDRAVHLLSRGEYWLFLMLEWDQRVVDIREQFPINRAKSQEVASRLGISHPVHRQTSTVAVMTIDLLATYQVNGKRTLVAYDVKTKEDLKKKRTVEKLEIMRSLMEDWGIHHQLITTGKPTPEIENLDWIRMGRLRRKERQPFPKETDYLTTELEALIRASPKSANIRQICVLFDSRESLPKGSGIRLLKLLLLGRRLRAPLTTYQLLNCCIAEFLD